MKAAEYFSFLPLNHVAERMIVEIAALVTGGAISFGESIDTFARNLQDTQPTLFFAVPRIWSKFQLAIYSKIPPPVFRFLMKVPGLNSWLRRTLRYRLGLSRAEILLTGASITPQYLKDWYRELGMELREVYGSTEITGGVTLMPAGQDRAGTVGRPVDETEIRIDDETGEILARVPWTMTEYYENPELTAAVLHDGWYHTGDRGRLDEAGFLVIEGRVRDTFKTAKGKFVAPALLEEPLAAHPAIEQVCVVGLGLPHPLALINLSEGGKKLGADALRSSLSQLLQTVNASLERHYHLASLVITAEDWTIANNLLTPTLKVRRQAIDQHYQAHYLHWHDHPEQIIWQQ
jgi:long-subunit acyl-CoA synthetase (AMP-forming)